MANYYLNDDGKLTTSQKKKNKKGKNYTLQSDGTVKLNDVSYNDVKTEEDAWDRVLKDAKDWVKEKAAKTDLSKLTLKSLAEKTLTARNSATQTGSAALAPTNAYNVVRKDIVEPYNKKQETYKNIRFNSLPKEQKDYTLKSPLENYMAIANQNAETITAKKKATEESKKEQAKQNKATKNTEETEERTWFTKGALEDGVTLENVLKTIGGTGYDMGQDLLAGALGIVESTADTATYLSMLGMKLDPTGTPYTKALKERMAQEGEELIKKDIINEEKIADTILGYAGGYAVDYVADEILGVGKINTEENSVLGEKNDSLAQSVGQLAAQIGLQAVGVPWFVTSGVTSFGSGVEQALNAGASFEEAGLSAAAKAGAEILTEKLFGGSGLGEKGLINVDLFTKSVSNKAIKTLLDFGIDVGGEGLEEVTASFIGRLAEQLTYEKPETWEELLYNEEAMDKYIKQVANDLFGKEALHEYSESFAGGAVLGGGMNSVKMGTSIKNGTDYRTGLTANDQKVFDKVYNDAIAEAEKDGKKLTSKEKAEIYDSVMEQMDKGAISTDTIEEVLGGDTYKAYKSSLEQDTARKNELDELKKEYKTLYEMRSGDKSDAQVDRQAELKNQIDTFSLDSNTKELKTQLDKSIMPLVEGGKLAESYNEKARRSQAFTVDLNKYKGKQKEAVERAVNSGVLNNTYRSHELVDILSKIEADKGIVFDYADNAKLKELGYALEGKTINGFEKGGKVTLNVQSAKAWESVVGHEIGHVFEGTQAYTDLRNALFAEAESRGELESRRKALAELYKDTDADIDAELTADLIGDYLFNNPKFIKSLTTNKNLFQKIWDEVKYLYKVATGKERTQMEKVELEFRKAWEEFSAKDINENGKTNLSMSGPNSRTADTSLLAKANDMLTDGVDSETIRQETGWHKGYDGEWRYEIDDSDMDFNINGHFTNPDVIRYKELEYKFITDTDNITEAEINELQSLSKTLEGVKKTPKTLGDYLKHDKLFEAYPELKDIKLTFDKLDGGTLGKYRIGKNEIILDNSIRDDNAKIKTTLIHEIQHAIQEIEGFANGSSVKYWEEQRQDIIDTIRGARENLDLWLDDIGYNDFNETSIQQVINKEKSLEQHRKDLEEFKANSKYAEQIALCEAELAEFQREYDEITNGMSAYEQYKNTAGEIEARDVENRLNLTAEERKNTRPDIDKSDVVFAEGGVLHYSAKESNNSSIKQQLREHLEEVNALSPVADVNYVPTDKKTLRSQVEQEFKKFGYAVDRQGFGIIEIGEGYINQSLDYLNTEAEKAAIWTVPKVLKRGIEISGHKDHKGRSYGTVTIAAPVSINGKVGNVAVTVKMTGKNRYSTHRILMPDGSEFVFEENKNTGLTSSDMLATKGEQGTDIGPVFNETVPQNGTNVKTNFSLSEATDNEYMSAVEKGDMETAQRLVNEAAEKSGYTTEDGYRGVHYAPVAQIDKEYFTDLEKLQELQEESYDLNLYAIANGISLQPDDYFGPNGARWYMYNDADGMESYRAIKPAMNSIQQQMEQYGEVREMPKIKVYRAVPKTLKETKLQSGGQWVTPSYMYAVKHGNNALNGKYKIIEETVSAENLWWDANDIREWGFDDGTNYAYRDTRNNRKLLDAVTYDDDGNVIPLSKRFNYRNADERYSLSPEGEQIAPTGTPLQDLYLAPTQEDVAAMENAATENALEEAMYDDDIPMPTDADAPPVDNTEYYNIPDTTAIDDKTLKKIGKSLRDTLYLTPQETKAIQEIVQEYSTTENPNKEALFDTIKRNFGEKIWKEKIEQVAEVKNFLRKTKVSVSPKIKSDITDYSAFRKRIGSKLGISKDGLPVDVAYGQLVEMYPEFFSDEIWNETEQFLRMVEVANNDSYVYESQPLDDVLIQEAVNIILNDVREYKENLARQAAEFTANEALDGIAPPKAEQIMNGTRGDALLNQSLDNFPVKTVENLIAEKIRAVEASIADNKQLRREAEVDFNKQIENAEKEYARLKDKNTKKAANLINRVVRLYERKSIMDAEYAKRISDLETRAEKIKSEKYNRAMHKQESMQGHAKWAEELLGDTSTWVDKKTGLQYEVNTERRNLRDIVRDENGNKDIARADAIDDALNGKYNREEAAKKRELAEVRKKYADLKINNKESAYIQMLGELRGNPETTLTEKVVNEYYEQHKNKIDKAKVDTALEYARQDYDNLFNRVNAELRKQGMKEIPYRQGYFPHFTEPKQNFIQKLLNWKVQDNEIPTSIAGLTEDFKPAKSWQSFDKTRHSDTTDYDFLKGFDNYSNGALDWIYHLDTLQKRRAIENHIRSTHSDEGIQKRIKEVLANEELDADEAQAQIEHILAEAKNPLNNFVQDFMTKTNILTGKKNSLDRTVEQSFNRKIYSVMTNVQNRTSANMVLANVRSALTNFIPITQSWAQVSPMRSLQATKETIANAIKDDGTIEKSTFLTNRLREVDNLYQTNWDKVLDKAGIMFEIIDNFSSQVIWRSKYNDNLAKGMSEAQAIKNADQFAENVMAGRSKGNEPTLFNAKNPFVKAFTMFQLEVNNQYGYLFKDVPNDLKAETKHWKFNLAKGYTTAFIGAYVYNALLEQVAGSGAALDPIGIIEDLLRDLGLFDDDEEEEPKDVLMNLVENVGGELPFVGGTLFGGGRIPISSAIPYGDDGLVNGIGDFVTDVTEGNWQNIGKEMMNPILNIGLPVGGNQIKKTYQGLSMFNTDEDHPIAGSYTDSGALRFPVEDTLANRIQAGIFGQYTSKNAREYFDNGYAPLKEKQIQEYIDSEMPISDYWKYREGLNDLAPLEGKKSVTVGQKADYINSLDITNEQKNLLMNNILDRKEDVDMTNYGDYGSWKEFDYAQKQPEKYAFAKSVGGYSSYKTYSEELYDIKADKDENGKSISGSRKEKVIDYINDLDADYETKIILYKSEYPSDDTYNAEIIEYINNRNDLTYEERISIYTELGFTVKNGYVYWD